MWGSLANRGSSTAKIWAWGCAHVGTDDGSGRSSITEAVADQKKHFDVDVILGLGDFFGSGAIDTGAINDTEGQEIADQIATLDVPVEYIYPLAGNHDNDPSDFGGTGLDGYAKWIDPLCDNTASSGRSTTRQPYPIASGGTVERYKFELGNILFLMLSDINYNANPSGRGTSETDGYPAGRTDSYDWWETEVAASPSDQIVITCAHHMLRETTIATGDDEGTDRNPAHHSDFAGGYPTGAGYLAYIGATVGDDFQDYLALNNAATDIWLGAHTHADPDDTYNARGMIEKKNGTVFCNCSSLTKYKVPNHAVAMSRMLYINGDQLLIRCYLHDTAHAPRGWYGAVDTRYTLSTPFRR